MRKLTIFLLCIILISCNNSVKEDTGARYDRDKFFTIDYEQVHENKTAVPLSEIASGIEYIRLETNDKCLLHLNARYHFTDDFIFINNITHILQFDRSGKFIKQIGKQGRGPGEIGLIRELSVLDDKKQLVVQTNWARKLYYFSYEGEFLRSVPVSDVRYIKAIPGNRLIYAESCAYGYEDYLFLLVSEEGDTLDVVNNYYKWENKSGRVMTVGYHLFRTFYEYNGHTSFKFMYNDTVYSERGDSIITEYLIDLGRYALPQENRPEVPSTGPSFTEVSKGYHFVTSFEANEMLFISSQEYTDNLHYHMLYYRPQSRGQYLVNSSGEPASLINDIDGGIDFWPRAAVNDSIVYMPVLPHQIMNEEFRDEISTKTFTDEAKRNELLEMINDLNENDNPILMVVKLSPLHFIFR